MKKLLSKAVALVASVALAASCVPAAYADSSTIVTLGADLSADQRATVLEFFGLSEDDLNNMEVITVTNADEHEYCDGSIPKDVTGSRTLSCSYIQPTTSGGINVKTANLTYVTSDVLYNALQTAGVENCNLVVTAPFDVSGTGALTGVFMAYEAQGYNIDDAKKDIAVEEMYETAGLEETYGEGITAAIGEAKDAIANATEDMSTEEIQNAIKEAAANNGVNLSDEDLANITSLLEKIQGLDYDADAFANTLNKLQDSVEGASGVLGSIQSFFANIANFFSGLFGGNSGSGSSIIDSLNTNVFSLDS